MGLEASASQGSQHYRGDRGTPTFKGELCSHFYTPPYPVCLFHSVPFISVQFGFIILVDVQLRDPDGRKHGCTSRDKRKHNAKANHSPSFLCFNPPTPHLYCSSQLFTAFLAHDLQHLITGFIIKVVNCSSKQRGSKVFQHINITSVSSVFYEVQDNSSYRHLVNWDLEQVSFYNCFFPIIPFTEKIV